MKTIHIILGDMINQLLPLVVKSYSVNLVISIGKSNLTSPLFEIMQANEYEEYKGTLNDIREIVNKLHLSIKQILSEIGSIDKMDLFVCLSSQNTKECLIMNYLSQSISCVSYYLDDSKLIEMYPYRIESISPLEFKILELIYDKNNVESLKELIDIIDLNETDYTKATAKMGYVINKLARSNYIERSKDGRSVQVNITPEGRQFILLFSQIQRKVTNK